MASLVDFDLQCFQTALSSAGYKPAHARQVLRHFYRSAGEPDFSSLPIGGQLTAHLAGQCSARRSKIIRRCGSADGTSKLLIGFAGGGAVEAVLMPSHRPEMAAGCVSSQIGCAMGCDFCASTRNCLERNLDGGEIVEQFLHLKLAAAELGRRLRTIVFMGMGEPLLNLDAVLDGIRRIADPDLGGLGWRQVTVSTVGIVPGIQRLADADLNVHLALSLHAPDDATRSRLVPANRRYTVADIMAAIRRFQATTRRTSTIEYCMLAGVNDSDEQAHLLADLMEGFRAHVNLIPYNSIGPGISGVVYERPTRERMSAFLAILRSRRVVAHFRGTRGDDVNAACGQLRQQALAVVS